MSKGSNSLGHHRQRRQTNKRRNQQRKLTLEPLEARDLPAPLTWSLAPSLPSARGGVVASVQSNQWTTILGGPTTDVPYFPAVYPSWNQKLYNAQMIDIPRASPGVGQLSNGETLLFGEQSGPDVLDDALEYDSGLGVLNYMATMSTPRAFMGSATDENYHVYAVGGNDGNGSVLSSAEWFNLTTNTWTRIASLPKALQGLAAVGDGQGHVFAIGGTDASGHLSSAVYEYTIATNTWAAVASLPTPTTGAAAVRGPNGLIYVLGGVTGTGTTANIESYNEATNTWTAEAPLPAPVSGEAVIVDSLGRILVAGGYDTGNNPVATMYSSQELNQPDSAPAITSTQPTGGVVLGSTYTYQVWSTGNPQPIYTLTAGPAGMTVDLNTGLVSWTPGPNQDGVYGATVQASNYAGSASQSFSASILPPIPTGVAANGSSTTSITVSWNASTDPNVVAYNVYLRTFIHNPKGSGGHYVYGLAAGNVTGTSVTIGGLSQGVSKTYVVAALDAAGLESPYSAAASGTTYFPATLQPDFLWGGAVYSSPVPVTYGQSVQITLLGNGNPSPTYTVVSGPGSVSVDPVTGVVTYTPGPNEVGQIAVTYQAANSTGSGTQTFYFQVSPATNGLVWTGNGATGNWSDPNNWYGGVAPGAGSNLVFGPGASHPTSTNDLPAGPDQGWQDVSDCQDTRGHITRPKRLDALHHRQPLHRFDQSPATNKRPRSPADTATRVRLPATIPAGPFYSLRADIPL